MPTKGMRVEETDPAITFTGSWTKADPTLGWSGGAAVQSNAAGATATITFSGTSIRWIGSRGRHMGIATLSVDGGTPRKVDTFARPSDEAHTQVVTVSDLSDGKHTLVLTVTGTQNEQAEGTNIVLDAFDIQPDTTISHWQDTDPTFTYSGTWTKSSENFPWSGSGVSNLPELPVTAQESVTAGSKVSIPFRGTQVNWVGYKGPDAGIATVQVDGGAPTQVDLFAPASVYQPVVFIAGSLADTNHTLTITATGTKNASSSAARVVVDAIEVVTPGRRYEEYDPAVTYTGTWTMDNDARVWSEGVTATNNVQGSTATFSFVGTSVSWIGCEKGSAGGTADVYLDGTFQKEIRLSQNYPIEGYQMTIFRADGLVNGPHKLTIQVMNTDGSYVVVDAFDVHP